MKQRSEETFLQSFLRALLHSEAALASTDVLLVNLGFTLSYVVLFGFHPAKELWPYLHLLPWLALGAVVIFNASGLYTGIQRQRAEQLVYHSISAVLVFMLYTMAMTFWIREFGFPRRMLLISAALQIVFIAGFRVALLKCSREYLARRSVMVVGETWADAVAVADRVRRDAGNWLAVSAIVSVNETYTEELLAMVDTVLLSSSLSRKTAMITSLSIAGKEVLVVPEAADLCIFSASPQQLADLLVLSIAAPTLRPGQMLVKRVFDVVVSSVLLLLASPIMLVLWILIPLTSNGPALFRQERLGWHRRPFNMLKFRTMYCDAEAQTGPVLARSSDPRLTRLGQFLRAGRLDELPQLINVLKGDMSLVGPRPEREFFIQQFETSVPDYAARLAVKPGMTGLAQVSANYCTSAEDKLRFDLLYIREYSLISDFRILMRTLGVAFTGTPGEATLVREEAVELETSKVPE